MLDSSNSWKVFLFLCMRGGEKGRKCFVRSLKRFCIFDVLLRGTNCSSTPTLIAWKRKEGTGYTYRAWIILISLWTTVAITANGHIFLFYDKKSEIEGHTVKLLPRVSYSHCCALLYLFSASVLWMFTASAWLMVRSKPFSLLIIPFSVSVQNSLPNRGHQETVFFILQWFFMRYEQIILV